MPREAKRGQVGSLEKPWASVVAESVVINLDGEYVPVGSTFVQKTNYEADQSRVSMLLSGLRTDVDVVTADARTTRESLPEFSDYTRTLLKQPSVEAWRASLAVPKVDGSDASGVWEIDITGRSRSTYEDDQGNAISSTYLTRHKPIIEEKINLVLVDEENNITDKESVLELYKHPQNNNNKIVQLGSTDLVMIASSIDSDELSDIMSIYGSRFTSGTCIFGKQIMLLAQNGAAFVNPGGFVSVTGGFAVEMKLSTSAVTPAVGDVVGVYTGAAECCTRATTSTPVIGVCTAVVGQNVVCVVSGVTTVNVTGSVSIGSTLYVNSSGVCTTSGSNKVGIALSTPVSGAVRVLVRP
jgi:hypothetical protein